MQYFFFFVGDRIITNVDFCVLFFCTEVGLRAHNERNRSNEFLE